MFYKRFFGSLVNGELNAQQKAALARIPDLTPGDFKVVKARLGFSSQKPAHDQVLKEIRAESTAKASHDRQKPIGFSA